MFAAAARPFPRAVPTYVGRDVEIARALELLDRETLHLVYGVGGVGKSELVYKLVEEAGVTARWVGAVPLLIAVRPGMAVEHVLAAMRLGARARRPRGINAGVAASFDDELSDVARLLDASALLVFVDDVHHLDLALAGPMLGYLSRHVRASRIIVSSRVEVPLPAGTPPPAVHRLGPLDEDATVALVAQLSDRLGNAGIDAHEVFRRTGGSPFHVLRELAGERGEPGSASGLDTTLHELDAGARALLLALSCARSRFVAEELAVISGDDASRLLRELSRRFLVDTGRPHVMVHELVRDAVLRIATRRDLAAAHRAAADVHRARLEPGLADEGRRIAIDPTDAVDAIHHLIRAGEVDDAWELASRTYRTVAAAGLDHLLLDDLRTLGAALAEAREPIVLMTARIQIRRSLISEAAETLATTGDRGAEASHRWLALAGEVAQRRGRLGDAEQLFRRARACAEAPTERFQAALAIADVASLRGGNKEARALLDEALREYRDASPRDRARLGWSLALSYLMEERFAAAAAAARPAAQAIAGTGLDDLELLLAMLEVLARCECDDVAGSHALLERVVNKAAAMGALREHVVDLYGGLLRSFSGDATGAREVLGRAFAHLEGHGDHVMSSIGGYYIVRTMLALGDVAGAIDMSARMTRLASDSGLETLAPHGRAAQAEAHLVAGRLAEARALADAALGSGKPGQGARWLACTVLARCAAIEGELATARRLLAEAEADALASLDDAAGDDATLAAGRAAMRAAGALELAGIELHGGDPDVAAAAAQRAYDHYRRTGRLGMVARAAVARAAALVVRAADPARTPDLAVAGGLLDEAERAAEAGGHARVLCRVAMVRAALAVRRGDHDGALVALRTALAAPWAQGEHNEARSLRAVVAGTEVSSGVRAVLASLGLVAGARHRVTTRAGSRIVVDAELERVRGVHRVVVEPSRAAITAQAPGRDAEPRVDRGRPLACELLAALVDAQGQPVAAEQLFLGVWGGHEYHPLRHRNTVYVAVKRLRQTLRALLDDDRELIETTAAGWRLTDGIDIALIRPLNGGPE